MSVGVLCSTKWLPHAQNRPLKRLLDQVRVTLIALSEKTYLCPENGLLIHVSSQVVRPLSATLRKAHCVTFGHEDGYLKLAAVLIDAS